MLFRSVGVAANLVHKVAKAMKQHYHKVEAGKLSVQDVERMAREAAAADGVKVVTEEPEHQGACDTHDHDHKHEHGHKHEHAEKSGECGDGGCPSCDDSLPGEQKARSPEATVGAAVAAQTDKGSCGDSCGCN